MMSSLLLPFCQFLLYRVETEDLELLQRVVSEFLSQPRSFETVDDIVRLAFPLVAILPIDNTDAADRARADVILMRMRQRREGDKVGDGVAELRVSLAARIELRNWDWLEQIYDEFCVGDDYCLQEFIALQRQAINMIPVRPVPVQDAPESPVSVKTVALPAPVVKPNKSKRAKVAHPQPTHDTREAVLQVLLAIEKQRPWETIFDVPNIQYPFDETKHPKLAAELKTFWERHARAVWERMFWFHYESSQSYPARQEERKARQDVATRSFELHAIARAFKDLGPEFFVDLDEQPERHYWWWYRAPVVDMLSMGQDRCIQYLKQKAFERFPDPPAGFELKSYRHNKTQSESMWAALAKYQYIRDAVATHSVQRQVTASESVMATVSASLIGRY